MFRLTRKFKVPPAVDVIQELDRQWAELKGSLALKPGMEIAGCARAAGA